MNVVSKNINLDQGKQVSKDAVAQLGDALKIDPKLLELNEGEFAKMLEGMTEEQKTALKTQILETESNLNKEQVTLNKELPKVEEVAKVAQPQSPDKNLSEILNKTQVEEISAEAPKETKQKSIFVNNSKSDIQQTLNNAKIGEKDLKIGDAKPEGPKFVVDEQGRKELVIERKSIFDIPGREAKVVEKQAVQAKNASPVNPKLLMGNSEDELALRQLVKQPNVKVNNVEKNLYVQQGQKNLFESQAKGQTQGLVQQAQKVVPANIQKIQPQTLDMLNVQDPMAANFDASQIVNAAQLEAGTSGQDQSQMNMNSGNKILQMDQIKTQNTQEIITKIQDYIVQAKVASEPEVRLSVKHEDLGQLDILVRKEARGDMVSVKIATHTQEGAKFFQQNQTSLLQSLTQSGVNVAEFKMDSSNMNQQSENSNQSFSDQLSQNGKNAQNKNQQRQNQEDSQRREHLWQMGQDQMHEAA